MVQIELIEAGVLSFKLPVTRASAPRGLVMGMPALLPGCFILWGLFGQLASRIACSMRVPGSTEGGMAVPGQCSEMVAPR